jgi:hypothetical protein
VKFPKSFGISKNKGGDEAAAHGALAVDGMVALRLPLEEEETVEAGDVVCISTDVTVRSSCDDVVAMGVVVKEKEGEEIHIIGLCDEVF